MGIRAILLASLLALVSIGARADEIYSYSGPAPASLSGSFTIAQPLALGCSPCGFDLNAAITGLISFNFTDGVHTWTPDNSQLLGEVNLSPDGSFSVWSFGLSSLSDPANRAYSITNLSAFYYEDYSPMGNSWDANQASWDKPKGSWTIVSAPEPGTLILAAVGIGTLLIIGWLIVSAQKKRKGGDAT